MKTSGIIFLAFLILIPLTSGCRKKDNQESSKAVTIRKITGGISADSLESYDTWLQNMGTRFALAANNRAVAVSIQNRLKTMGYENARLDSFEFSTVWGSIDSAYSKTEYNVIAELEGSSGDDSVCILGAHYDDITGSDPLNLAPGGNDNGSGVSVMLETARVLKKNGFVPSSTIRFIAFAAEEPGLLGSSSYAENALGSGEKIRFMLNNDMVAHEPGADQQGWYVDIMDYSNSVSLREEAETACLAYSILKPYNDNTYSHYSDSYMFFTRGYKALFFFASSPDPNYHTVNDLVSTCNFTYCREVAKVNCAILINKN
jgi:hypothetical protein